MDNHSAPHARPQGVPDAARSETGPYRNAAKWAEMLPKTWFCGKTFLETPFISRVSCLSSSGGDGREKTEWRSVLVTE